MFPDQIEIVLVSTQPEPSRTDRIVVALRHGDELYIPLDSARAANQELMECETLYIRRTNDREEVASYQVESHSPIQAPLREELEAYVHKPLSVSTEVVHLQGSHVSVETSPAEPAGFVAVIDTSDRALAALAPAVALADFYDRPLTVWLVGTADEAAEVAAKQSLEVAPVDATDLDARLLDLMRQGNILVASAFGVWEPEGQLYGLVNGLVRHNAPAIIGVGPKVPADWKPAVERPLLIFVDDTDHAHDVVERIDSVLPAQPSRVVVVHVLTDDQPDSTIADQVANEIERRYGFSVEARSIAAPSAAVAIATISATLEAQMAVVTSWHRPQLGAAAVASTSLMALAHAPCPVVVLAAS